ncbi:hypothetical protein BHM03_00020915 [Ensete ventricosum]|nr:hypothetical protein BHM03_00020915 [Ensete ventricosum]
MVINIAQSRGSISFSRVISEIQNTGHSQRISPWEVVRAWFHEKIRWSSTLRKVEVRSIFRAPSQKSKVLVIPNYEPMESRTCKVSRKNMMVINFAQS